MLAHAGDLGDDAQPLVHRHYRDRLSYPLESQARAALRADPLVPELLRPPVSKDPYERPLHSEGNGKGKGKGGGLSKGKSGGLGKVPNVSPQFAPVWLNSAQRRIQDYNHAKAAWEAAGEPGGDFKSWRAGMGL